LVINYECRNNKNLVCEKCDKLNKNETKYDKYLNKIHKGIQQLQNLKKSHKFQDDQTLTPYESALSILYPRFTRLEQLEKEQEQKWKYKFELLSESEDENRGCNRYYG
jgi:hypothetical protein